MIDSFMKRVCLQTAVYWGSPVADGYGGKTFADPVEIDCRWENRVEKITRVGDRLGEEVISRARVFVTQDVEELGWLYLGELDDLDSNPDNPKEIAGAYEIIRFDKIPEHRSTTEFVRKAYL